MATTEPTHGYSVQIDRLTRDALWRGVQAELELASDSLKHRAGDGMGLNARLLARRVHVAASLLEDLGWDELDGRRAFTITTPERRHLTRLLESVRDQTIGVLDDQRQDLVDARDGGRPGRIVGTLIPREPAMVEAIDRDLETLSACDAVLQRLAAFESR
jgi:hypothetical protein